jgi:hypothetical protein
MLDSEREARAQEDRNPEAVAEQDDWDTTVGDGID